MNKQRLQQIIQEEIVKEISNGSTFIHYPEYGAEFPMLDKGYFQRPEEIDTEKDYLKFQSSSTNQDLDKDEFPYEELKKGIEFERVKNSAMNHFEVAEIAISNLKNDAKFYTKFFDQDPIENEVGDLEDDREQQGQDYSSPERKTMQL